MSLFAISALIIFLLFIIMLVWGAIVSYFENEKKAAVKLTLLCLPVLIFSVPLLWETKLSENYAVVINLLFITALIAFILPLQVKKYSPQIPAGRIDERDTMFSRKELEPGSKKYDEYYDANREKLELDNKFREKPGLLKEGTTQWNKLQFAAAESGFAVTGFLKDKVDGPAAEDKYPLKAEIISDFLKEWGKKLGAVDSGITLLHPYHYYSAGGRGDRYGVEYNPAHKFGIAFIVEMDHRMMQSAPSGTVVMESSQQYLQSGSIAVQTAHFIRSLGYSARAHIDGNYQVVCPLVARDAGLGEIGRMGLLMTPSLGPRVRISVVTTDLELIPDKYVPESSMLHFCRICRKCSDSCPAKAIPGGEMEIIDGAERWKINQESCFTLWCTLGTDCGRCVAVCPYSHPDNGFHRLIRFGLQKSSLFRRTALLMDDLIYGRKPASKPPEDWLSK